METLLSLRSYKVKDVLGKVRNCVEELRQSIGKVTDLKGTFTEFIIKEVSEHGWVRQERK